MDTSIFKEMMEQDLEIRILYQKCHDLAGDRLLCESVITEATAGEIISTVKGKISEFFTSMEDRIKGLASSADIVNRVGRINEMLTNCPSFLNKKLKTTTADLSMFNSEDIPDTVDAAMRKVDYLLRNGKNLVAKRRKEVDDEMDRITTTATPDEQAEIEKVFKLYEKNKKVCMGMSDVLVLMLLYYVELILFMPNLVKGMAESLITAHHHMDKDDKSDLDDIEIHWKDNVIDRVTVNGTPVTLYTVPNGMKQYGEIKIFGKMVPMNLSPGVAATYRNAGGYGIMVMDKRFYKMFTKEQIVAILYHEIGHMTYQFDNGSWYKKANILHKNRLQERSAYMKELQRAFAIAIRKYGSEYCSHLSIWELEADYRAARNGKYKEMVVALNKLYENEKSKYQITEWKIRVFVLEYMHSKGFF